MLIYISHAYSGKEENKIEVEQIVRQLIKEYPQHTFISPIHTFGYLYKDVEYAIGLQMCLNLLAVCDVMWVYGEQSKGVLAEIEWCIENKKPFTVVKDSQIAEYARTLNFKPLKLQR